MNNEQTATTEDLFTTPALFSEHILHFPLYQYQIKPITAVLNSVLNQKGDDFLWVMPRQSGKNEAIAHLQVMLLNLFQRTGGNIVFGAIGDGIGRGKSRLEERLDNILNEASWGKATKPMRRTLGRAAVAFLSSHTTAHARGETAQILLIIDELQDQSAPHLEQVFEPMRAAYNTTAVSIGTVRLKTDALWQKKVELERKTREDGLQRVFFITPDKVIAENPLYAEFLRAKVNKYGRKHPIIAAEYFLEPIDADGGLFPPRRIALMTGTHSRQRTPQNGRSYIAVIDVGGQDEATTDPVAQLTNPKRDYTTVTIFDAELTDSQPYYKAVNVLMLHGKRHFESSPGNPSATEQIETFLNHWQVAHTIIDETGVGEGVQSWLASRFPNRVTGYKFSRLTKAALGSMFISLVENGRFQYWQSEMVYDDAWWFFTQAAACGYEIKIGGDIERDMSWSVPNNHKTDTPSGKELTHDDRILSAALIAAADELVKSGIIVLGQAKSAVIKARDVFEDMEF